MEDQIFRWVDDETGAHSVHSLCGFADPKKLNLKKLKNGIITKVKWPEPTEDGSFASYQAKVETWKVRADNLLFSENVFRKLR